MFVSMRHKSYQYNERYFLRFGDIVYLKHFVIHRIKCFWKLVIFTIIIISTICLLPIQTSILRKPVGMLSQFGNTYVCKIAFSALEQIK